MYDFDAPQLREPYLKQGLRYCFELTEFRSIICPVDLLASSPTPHTGRPRKHPLSYKSEEKRIMVCALTGLEKRNSSSFYFNEENNCFPNPSRVTIYSQQMLRPHQIN